MADFDLMELAPEQVERRFVFSWSVCNLLASFGCALLLFVGFGAATGAF